MMLAEKKFRNESGKVVHVVLKKDKYYYTVLVDNVPYKHTPNELFAVQAFNEI